MRKISSGFLAVCFALVVFMQPFVSEAQVIDKEITLAASDDEQLGITMEPKISQEDAIAIALEFAKEYIAVELNDEYEMDIYLEDYSWRSTSDLFYSIYFSKYDDSYSKDISFEIDAMSGEVVSFDQWEYDYNSNFNYIPKLSYDEAKVISNAFLKKIQPVYAKGVMLEEDDNYGAYPSETYSFQYVRVHNDIPFDTNYINIDVDAITGKIDYYSIGWHEDVQFVEVSNMISNEEAYKILADSCTVELNYVEQSNPDTYETEAIVAVYEPRFNKYMINAEGGNEFEYVTSYIVDDDEVVTDLSSEDKERLKDISIDIPQPANVTYTDEEVNNVALIYKDLMGITDMKIDGTWLYDYDEEKLWSVELQGESNPYNYSYSSMDIEAETGKLTYYSHNGEDKEYMLSQSGTEEKMSWEEAYKEAVAMIATLYPNEFKEIITKQTYYDNSYYYDEYGMEDVFYYFSFSRGVNGIEYYNNSIDIEIGAYSGDVNSIYYTWSKLEFPKFENLISEKEAIDAYLNHYESHLSYVMEDYESADKKAIPVYTLEVEDVYSYPAAVDAKTGEVLDYWGNSVTNDKIYVNFEGHPSEKELTIMQQYGFIDYEGVSLQDDMTVTEFIKILVNILGYSSYYVEDDDALKFTNVTKEDDAYDHLMGAIYYGLVENEAIEWDFDKVLNREEMAMYMVKMLGYNDLAELSSIYKASFSDAEDISKDLMGYVAIGEGLGILKGEDGKFYPKKNVTYEEAAVALYNLLSGN
ncbi:S-layer homology domain-containing protein [Vallitalea okinawensis]|uniref:S-layer homology domain-containing protein n=1 Tax=Vallitalea okinawensis TaxID=2078660 RepID=UPI000CFB3DCD|nr:S-layer homology domain-containing protein [Vallitalea okinawensis]